MQSTTPKPNDTPDENSNELFDTLASSPALKILQYTSEPHTASALSDRTDLPITVCEQLLEQLVDAELLRIIDSSNGDGSTQVYQREVDGVNIAFANEDASVETQHGAAVKNRLSEVWDTLADANS